MDARFQPTCSTFGSHLGSGKPPPLSISWNHPRPGQEFTVHHVAASESFGYFACFFFSLTTCYKNLFLLFPRCIKPGVFFFPHRRFRTTEQPMFFFKGIQRDIWYSFLHTHTYIYIHINIYDCKSLTEDGKFRPITIFLYLNELPDNSGVRSPRWDLELDTLQDQLTKLTGRNGWNPIIEDVSR